MGRKSAPPSNGFTDNGQRYVLRDVHRIDAADSDLWNDTHVLQIDHRGRCSSSFLQPDGTQYSQNLRCVYLRDEQTGKFWSAPYDPVQVEPDEFEFSPGLHDIRWRNVTEGIETALQLTVPREDNLELWSVRVTNRSRRKRAISVYPFLPMGKLALLVIKSYRDERLNAIYQDFFPYYVRIPDYFKLAKLIHMSFAAADVRPDAYEVSLPDFTGAGGLHNPHQLREKRLANAHGDKLIGDPSAAIFQYTRKLAPGEEFAVNLIFGPARDLAAMKALKAKYLRPVGFQRAARGVESFFAENKPLVTVQTPDQEFDHFVNHWLPRRLLICARTLRFNNSPQGRNVIQDAMGSVYVSPQTSRSLFSRIWAHQKADGWTPHGMNMVEGVTPMPIGQIPHRDINTWGPGTIRFYVDETGDLDVLNTSVPFADDPQGATLYEHINRGLEWLLRDRTERGLSRLGEGDWNDPLNMAGWREKGESIWLTEALAAALDEWAAVADYRADAERAARYRAEADRCRQAINTLAWDGGWYARGTTDQGRWFGTHNDKEGRIFLNAQSWAILSGCAKDPRRIDTLIRSIDKHLMTPSGPMMLTPPFEGMREDIGKITQKCPGTGENGSVYCHAATFYAYSLYMARRPDKAFSIFRTLLTGYGGNTLERSGQLPIYIPNFYQGLPLGSKAGRSSHSPNTGTAAWWYRTAIAMLLGVRGERDGLRIDPQLPSHWPEARVTRQFRGATYNIHIQRDRKAKQPALRVNGESVAGNLVAIQPAGSVCDVAVLVP